MNHEDLLKQCINHPDEHFSTPAAVLQDVRFNPEEKQRILESWKVDEEELLVATEENMGGGNSSRLQAVTTALTTLTSAN